MVRRPSVNRPSASLRVAEYLSWIILVSEPCVFAFMLLAYGLLGDWGRVTTDQLHPTSVRYIALVAAGTETLYRGTICVVAVFAYAILTVRLRRQLRAEK